MDVLKLKSNKTGAGYCVMLVLSMLVLLTAPASAFAQDDNVIATLRQIGRTFAGIAEKASPAVVALTIERPGLRGQLGAGQWWKVGSGGSLPIPPELPGNYQLLRPDSPNIRPRSTRIQPLGRKSLGLGFIVSDDGHILTCNHLIKDARKINAELADGREFEAEIVGTDPDTDIAVVKIEADNLPVLKLGDSDALVVGDWVVGISNAMGAARTFAVGLVTGKSRSGLGMAPLEDFVQTSINLRVGDGGGPLLDLDGKVVGVNFATFDAEHGGGISFAIPAGMAKGIYEQLIKTGVVERGFLGIALKDVNVEMAEALGLETTEGVIITDVIKDSAAEKAGIRKNDVLVEFNGKAIESASRLPIRVAELRPGTQVELVVLRGGQRQNLAVTLGKRPSMQPRTLDDVLKAP